MAKTTRLERLVSKKIAFLKKEIVKAKRSIYYDDPFPFEVPLKAP